MECPQRKKMEGAFRPLERGVQGMQHGIAALRDAMQSPTVLERPELAVSFEDLNALVGFAEVQARERRYTPPAASRT
jgi:hypothetical protein